MRVSMKVFLDEWEVFAVANPKSSYAVWLKLQAAINDLIWAMTPNWLRRWADQKPPVKTLRRYTS